MNCYGGACGCSPRFKKKGAIDQHFPQNVTLKLHCPL